ncbi:hypothetical protein BDR05DRAFT_942670 [Suillus weaverae]|nr:hypothetical protein BDR05DRAFT_942670 [Suillus weaverae]
MFKQGKNRAEGRQKQMVQNMHKQTVLRGQVCNMQKMDSIQQHRESWETLYEVKPEFGMTIDCKIANILVVKNRNLNCARKILREYVVGINPEPSPKYELYVVLSSAWSAELNQEIHINGPVERWNGWMDGDMKVLRYLYHWGASCIFGNGFKNVCGLMLEGGPALGRLGSRCITDRSLSRQLKRKVRECELYNVCLIYVESTLGPVWVLSAGMSATWPDCSRVKLQIWMM